MCRKQYIANTNMQVVSDIHLETRKGQSKCIAKKIIDVSRCDQDTHQVKYLLLAGDIAPAYYPSLYPFLKILVEAQCWQRIFYLPGNHEYYTSRGVHQVEEHLHDLENIGVTILMRQRVELPEITLLGCTLWSKLQEDYFPEILHGYPDFNNIYINTKKITWSQYQELHQRDVTWLQDEIIRGSPKPLWVATHHLPSYRCLNPKFVTSALNSCFANHLDTPMQNVKTWIFGHSHYPVDMIIDKTRCISNPYSYSNEKLEWQSKILSLSEDLRSSPLPEVIC